jgi:hypothetical protein
LEPEHEARGAHAGKPTDRKLLFKLDKVICKVGEDAATSLQILPIPEVW